MQVLAVTPEIFPLIKTGGLADVTGALPIALARQGVTTRTLVPGYPVVMKAFRKKKAAAPICLAAGRQGLRLLAAKVAGLDLLVLDAPHLFDRPGGPYGDATGADWPDNWRRFAALSQAGADIAAGAIAGYRPDLVHAHDWQAAMTLAYMRYRRGGRRAVGDHRPQPRLPGPVRRRAFSASSACRQRPWRSTASNITAASAT